MKAIFISLCLSSAALASQAQELSATYYAGEPQKIILPPLPPNTSASWRIATSNRTLVSGSATANSSGKATVSFQIPELKSPNPMEAELSWNTDGGSLSKKIHLYPSNPFKDKIQVLNDLKIGLWTSKGEGSPLAALFKKHEIPFSNVDAISSFEGGILFLEGMDFDDNPGVFNALKTQCENNGQVVIVPPVKGSFKFDQAPFTQMLFAKEEGINAFSPKGNASRQDAKDESKLDAKLWGGKPIDCVRFKLDALDGSPCMTFAESGVFSYGEMKTSSGLLCLCGWDLAQGAKTSPTPLVILNSMFDNSINRKKEIEAK